MKDSRVKNKERKGEIRLHYEWTRRWGGGEGHAGCVGVGVGVVCCLALSDHHKTKRDNHEPVELAKDVA